MKKTFFSNGKLLLTGEYLVLDGANALAVPTRFGQQLDTEPLGGNITRWTSLDADGSVWLDESIDMQSIISDDSGNSNPQKATLIHILHHAHKANPEVFDQSEGFNVTTRLTFPRLWGLGSSSTLINNIALWFNISPYQLLAQTFGGSGYDIACAQSDAPLLYRLEEGNPITAPAAFNPHFQDKLYFVYLNRKQDSREAIKAYREQQENLNTVINTIDGLTTAICNTTDHSEFNHAIESHEAIMSKVLGIAPVKERLFPDFSGTVKSLGAWGGDFVLASGNGNPESYFRQKGFDTIVPWHEMVLNGGLSLSENEIF